jgi:GDP-L-fucose synthase
LNFNTKIYIAGHKGMVGSAVCRQLKKNGYTHLLGKTSKELDLRNQQAVQSFFDNEKPEIVIDCAARVGGILANNNHPYSFLMENLQIQNNLIEASLKNDIEKFIFLGSSCIYPKLAPQPLKEEYLLTDSLEPTNEYYAIAKIAGLKACEGIKKQFGKDFVSLMPTNLYGPNDNFDLTSSHVLPAMIRKFHEAKIKQNQTGNSSSVVLWGSGTPMREFLYVDDLADAVVFMMQNKTKEVLYNVGTGKDMSIKKLAQTIQDLVGHKGEIEWDNSKPDGTPKKCLDVTKLNKLGWKPQIDLKEGIRMTYEWFLKHQGEVYI